jgi:hypothetical protein
MVDKDLTNLQLIKELARSAESKHLAERKVQSNQTSPSSIAIHSCNAFGKISFLEKIPRPS